LFLVEKKRRNIKRKKTRTFVLKKSVLLPLSVAKKKRKRKKKSEKQKKKDF
jgi:hypothetical protein